LVRRQYSGHPPVDPLTSMHTSGGEVVIVSVMSILCL
jgi:hypothetical protein